MQVRLLGPVDVLTDGVSRPVPGLRRRAVLAVLALQPGQVVSTDRLLEVVWGEAAPSTAVNTLQRHVSHLRQVLGGRDTIVARSPGYRLDLGPDATDLVRAEELIHDGLRAPEPTDREQLLTSALRLWRGSALMDLTGLAWLEEQADRLDQLRTRARHALTEVRLALGEHTDLLPELERLSTDHPLDERLQRQLILALYRSGRQADALAAYQRLRATLSDELGIDPTPELRELETAILRQDPALRPVVVADPPPPPTAPLVPAQLPMAVRGFAGRAAELAGLDATLTDLAGSATVVTVAGMAGVGKTALALHWAHRVADRFPDGQLHVDLAGFAAPAAPLDPTVVLRGFLDALGVPPARLPADPRSQAGLYRTLVAGRRLLILLDNARDAAQVRPLLPGTAGSLVIVTSRRVLTGLLADGATLSTVEPFPVDDARDLLATRIGAARVAAEPGAVDAIIDRCGRLPLALAVASARALARPAFPLQALVDELDQAGGALDLFRDGAPDTDVGAVLSWSYQALPPEGARLYRLLGQAPGADLSTAAVASLAGRPVRVTRSLLADLVDGHLLREPGPGRFDRHDLVRTDAVRRARETDPPGELRSALTRLVDHFVHSGYEAARRVYPPGELPDAGPVPPGVTVDRPADVDAAVAWFGAERNRLSAVVAAATGAGLDAQVILIGAGWSSYLTQRCRYADQAVLHEAVLAAADRMGDVPAQVRARCRLGWAATGRGDHPTAAVHFGHALDRATGLDDDRELGRVHHHLSLSADVRGDHAVAIEHSRRSLVHYERADDAAGMAMACNAIAWGYALLRDPVLGRAYCDRALALLSTVEAAHVAAPTLDTSAHVEAQLGRTDAAVSLYRESVRVAQSCGDRMSEGLTWLDLGDLYDTAGQPGAAVLAWREALDILDEIGLPQTADVRARLAGRRR